MPVLRGVAAALGLAAFLVFGCGSVSQARATSHAHPGTTAQGEIRPEAARNPVREAEAALRTWRRDWENRDYDRFAAHHAEDFRAGALDRSAFLERKRAIFDKRPWHRVRLLEVLWIAEQARPDVLNVRFVQEYESPQGIDRTRKEQTWARIGDAWRIVVEREASPETDAARMVARPATPPLSPQAPQKPAR